MGRLSDLLTQLPGSRRWRIRAFWRVGVALASAGLLSVLVASIGWLKPKITDALEGAASVEISEKSKLGKLEKYTYRFSVTPQYRTWRLSHSPPCEEEKDLNCYVDLSIRQNSKAASWIVAGAAGSLLAIVGLIVVIVGGKEQFGVLFGKSLTMHHQMTIEGGVEMCSVTRKYEGMTSEANELIVPVELNYRYETKNNEVLELVGPVLKCPAYHSLSMTPVEKSNRHFIGEIRFPGDHRRKGVDFELVFSARRNFSRDHHVLKARWGDDAETDDHGWASTANLDKVVMVFDWAPEFRVEPPIARFRKTQSDDFETIPSLGDPRLIVASRKWTLALEDVEYGSEVQVIWRMST